MDQPRLALLSSVRSVVVKLGTQLLSDAQKQLDTEYISAAAGQIVELRKRGVSVTVVSSGAIGAGLRLLGLPKRPTHLPTLQAVAAVGQRRLMDAWAEAFEPYKIAVAQLLLTREDIDRRSRFLNLRNTLLAAHQLGAIPIINENDTVSTDEIVKISFGDNDILAALVTQAIRAELLVLLTCVDGLLDESGEPVRLVRDLAEAQQLVRKEKSALGKGGMDSKLQAARIVTGSGEVMVVADGRSPRVLPRILNGEQVGTLFSPAARKRDSRTRWLGSARAVGAILVDDGAVAALVQKNRSLLPAGVLGIEGHFHKGDLVEIKGPAGRVVARGLSNYDADVVAQIRGQKTSAVREKLGEAAYDEVVHRDNLVIA